MTKHRKHTASAALSGPQGVRGKRLPVLLVPGAGGDPGLAFSARLEPVLRANRFPVCTIALPDAAMSDNQIIAEYLVSSIRRMSACLASAANEPSQLAPRPARRPGPRPGDRPVTPMTLEDPRSERLRSLSLRCAVGCAGPGLV